MLNKRGIVPLFNYAPNHENFVGGGREEDSAPRILKVPLGFDLHKVETLLFVKKHKH